MTPVPGDVLVMGAGAIGCYLGGSLAAAGVPVTLVGRARTLDALAAHAGHQGPCSLRGSGYHPSQMTPWPPVKTDTAQ